VRPPARFGIAMLVVARFHAERTANDVDQRIVALVVV